MAYTVVKLPIKLPYINIPVLWYYREKFILFWHNSNSLHTLADNNTVQQYILLFAFRQIFFFGGGGGEGPNGG